MSAAQNELVTAAQFLASEPAIADIFRGALAADCAEAQLSRIMRTYYQLRPWIPLPVRQLLQAQRRRDASPRWCFPDEFNSALSDAVRAATDGVPLIHPWPDDAEWAFVLTHDIESADGLARAVRLAEIESEYGFCGSWNIVPCGYRIDMGVIAELRAHGCEIGIHGYNHDGRLFSSRRVFEQRAVAINEALAKYEAVGFRAPMVHRNLDWLQQLNVAYDASCFDKDPFQAMSGGVGGPWPFIAGRFVEMPYTLPQDHTLLVVLGEQDDRIWREKLAAIVAQSGMALMLVHPDYVISDARLDLYRSFLEHVRETTGRWHALPRDVARWWRERQQSQLRADGVGGWQIDGVAAARGRVSRLMVSQHGVSFANRTRVTS